MEFTVDLLNEVGMLAHTPRSGFAFLGSGQQSVAEHSYRTAVVALALAKECTEEVDEEKLLKIALFHDLLESRTGDLNYVQKRYVEKDDGKALDGLLSQQSPLAKQVANSIKDYEQKEGIEQQLVHDADQLELMLVLKQLYDTGNPKALEWMTNCERRIQTDAGRSLATAIRERDFDQWWKEPV